MPSNVLPLAISWAVLTLIVIALAIYKKRLDGHIDEHIHVSVAEEGVLKEQLAETHRSEVVEKWGKALTVVVFLYGLAIVGMLAYHQWVVASNVGFK
ncbi:MAG: hypothetical protein KIT83_03760 [Bryobacterales bacterium]|nr:hypothetical protein [Bryobacterales bacterium]